jgi:hypothetical protein
MVKNGLSQDDQVFGRSLSVMFSESRRIDPACTSDRLRSPETMNLRGADFQEKQSRQYAV